MNRFEKAADRISLAHQINVEWAPANREYVVDGIPCSNAREAEKKARKLSLALDEAARGNPEEWDFLHGNS